MSASQSQPLGIGECPWWSSGYCHLYPSGVCSEDCEDYTRAQMRQVHYYALKAINQEDNIEWCYGPEPCPDSEVPWCSPETCRAYGQASLMELRGLRDMYARKASAALKRRFPTIPPYAWDGYVDDVCRDPDHFAGIMHDQAILFCDMAEWAALDRCAALAERVAILEHQELREQTKRSAYNLLR